MSNTIHKEKWEKVNNFVSPETLPITWAMEEIWKIRTKDGKSSIYLILTISNVNKYGPFEKVIYF